MGSMGIVSKTDQLKNIRVMAILQVAFSVTTLTTLILEYSINEKAKLDFQSKQIAIESVRKIGGVFALFMSVALGMVLFKTASSVKNLVTSTFMNTWQLITYCVIALDVLVLQLRDIGATDDNSKVYSKAIYSVPIHFLAAVGFLIFKTYLAVLVQTCRHNGRCHGDQISAGGTDTTRSSLNPDI